MKCKICKKHPSKIKEYIEMAKKCSILEDFNDPENFVWKVESTVMKKEVTYDPDTDMFCCTDCCTSQQKFLKDLYILLKKHKAYFEGYFTVCFSSVIPPANFYFGPHTTTVEKIQMKIKEENTSTDCKGNNDE